MFLKRKPLCRRCIRWLNLPILIYPGLITNGFIPKIQSDLEKMCIYFLFPHQTLVPRSPLLPTTFAIENAPPNIPYGRMVKKTIRMKKPIHQCLGQLPITSTTARFHFGMNGKRVFDDSHVTWCQTLKRLFWGALA